MQKNTLKIYVQTICWFGEYIIDWSDPGILYRLSERQEGLDNISYGSLFDGAIASSDNVYALIYQRLGTKGLLLKNGRLMREVNRSYYQADVYEYPAAFFIYDGRTYLAHCPLAYNRIDFEDVETGEVITGKTPRTLVDSFYSRLEVGPGNKYLLSKGWGWHPVNITQVYDIAACFEKPAMLDVYNELTSPLSGEICTASFISDSKILVGPPEELIRDDGSPDAKNTLRSYCVLDMTTGTYTPSVAAEVEIGNLIAIDEYYAWDTYKYPKVIALVTGRVVDKDETVFSGDCKSSIIREDEPHLAINAARDKLVIKNGNEITLVGWER